MGLTKVKDITNLIEQDFPLSLAEDWDNSGLQLGSFNNEVQRIIISLDLNQAVVENAIQNNVDLIITHHPMFFRGIKSINYDSSQGSLIKSLIIKNITVYSAHTNLDAGEKGLNELLANKLGLVNIEPLYKGKQDGLVKLVVYVPTTHVEKVREAINGAGAGNIGNYSDCSFRSLGLGTFKPGKETNPFIGKPNEIEEVEEYRLETIVYKSNLNYVLKAMQESHPYEEVAYDIYDLQNEGKFFSMGRKGILPYKLTLKDFACLVKEKLNLEQLRVVGDLNTAIKKVAVVSGSGASFIDKVVKQNIDVLVTGDLKYHEARDAEALGLNIIDAGHQETEEIMVSWMTDWLSNKCKSQGIKVKIRPVFLDNCFKYL